MQKNGEYSGIVTGLGSNGEGVVKIDDVVCFVPYALVGEEITFTALKVNKNIAFCKLKAVKKSSGDRVSPPCKVFEKCGGCQLQHVSYAKQLEIKSQTVSDCFQKIAGLTVKIPLTVESENKFNYRNKLQLPVRSTKNGNVIGFFAENSHRVVAIDDCPIQQKWCKDIISILCEYIEKFKVSCYSDETHTGLLRHVVCRKVEDSFLIALVINGKFLPHQDELVKLLRSRFLKFSFFVNVNTLDSNVILGDEYKIICGEEKIETSELGIKYQMGIRSFMQVNNEIKSRIYSDALKYSKVKSLDTIIDAYSGAGLMTALFAKNAKNAIGIEIIKEAVDSANELARENGLEDEMVNVCGKCEEELPKIVKKLSVASENLLVVLDPPRKGCEREVLEAILSVKPSRITYISCSPQTLARDIGILIGSLQFENGELKRVKDYSPRYEISYIQTYDMFPQTKHVETLCVLEKINFSI